MNIIETLFGYVIGDVSIDAWYNFLSYAFDFFGYELLLLAATALV